MKKFKTILACLAFTMVIASVQGSPVTHREEKKDPISLNDVKYEPAAAIFVAIPVENIELVALPQLKEALPEVKDQRIPMLPITANKFGNDPPGASINTHDNFKLKTNSNKQTMVAGSLANLVIPPAWNY